MTEAITVLSRKQTKSRLELSFWWWKISETDEWELKTEHAIECYRLPREGNFLHQ